MKISALSESSGVSVATIKFYLREGLVPAGRLTATNQAEYDEQHVRRLRLIRALKQVGGMSVASMRGILVEVDSDTVSLHDAFGSVMHALDPPLPPDADAELLAEVDEVRAWLRRRSWDIMPEAPAIHRLAEALLTLRSFDFHTRVTDFDGAADSAEQVAELEVATARFQPDRTAAVETMLVGTLVYERALAELRRLALEAVSARTEPVAPARRRGRQ